jgi:hypothetical protein
MKKEIKVRSKDNKQFILKSDGTWERVINFKVGDVIEYIKKQKTSEGDIEVGDVFVINNIWENNKKSEGIYWIRCLNRKRDGSRGRKDEEWIRGCSLMDFNDQLDIYFIKKP